MNNDIIRVYIGYDPVESVAYHTCCESIIRNSSKPVSITPLYLPQIKGYKETHTGSNQFIHSRFLIPYLEKYKGSAIFVDGDMVFNADIAELWELRDWYFAVQVVKHDYKTKFPTKYLGQPNLDYPRKNWSSVMLFNCGNYLNRKLDPEYIMQTGGKELHRFEWLPDDRIGALPPEWNQLIGEYNDTEAKLYHYTIGTPCFKDYQKCEKSGAWWRYYHQMIYPLTGQGNESEL